ncbi:hypothetical protein ASG39_00025 [Rhizobium sp. Leaf371]|nr:hypothetical protein ASG39_00025 [Rhizobium sp. Leaf371]
MVDSWEDWIRIVSAGILHVIPFFMFGSAILALRRLDRERAYALKIANASNAAVGKTDDIVAISAKGSATRDDFVSLFGGDFSGGPPEASELFNELIQKSLSGRFEPTTTILSSYRETLSQDLSRLASAQRICLQGGVFFTFVGLGWGFSVAKFGSGTSLSNGNAIVDDMLGSLSLAFGTSIAGLLASITIILLAQIVRRRYIQTLLAFSVLVQAVFDLGRRLPQDKFFITQLSEISNAVGNSTEATRVANDRLNRLTDAIGSGLQELVSVRNSFDGAVNSILEDQRKLGDTFKAYIDTLDPEKLRRQIAVLVDQNNDSVAKDISRTSAALESTTEALAKITSLLEAMQSQRSRVEVQVPAMSHNPESRRRRAAEVQDRHVAEHKTDVPDDALPIEGLQPEAMPKQSVWRRLFK